MATPPSDDSKTMFRLLADNQWHEYQQLRDAIAATVPPGRALRKYQERLSSSRKVHQTANPTPELSEDEQIQYGARACAQIAISSWVGRGVIRKVENGLKYIKIKPGFKTYGIQVPVTDEPATEAVAEAPKAVGEAEGSPEVPPADSEPSESAREPQEGPSAPEPVVAAEDERMRTFVRSSDTGEWVRAQGSEEPRITRRLDPHWLPGPADAEPQAVAALPEPGEVAADDMTYDPGDGGPVEDHDLGPAASMASSPRVSIPEVEACAECGLMVLNQAQHERWHQDQKDRFEQKEMALFDEVAIRTLFSDELGQTLDAFQTGMERYLTTRFAQLELMISSLRTPSWQSGSWAERNVRKDRG